MRRVSLAGTAFLVATLLGGVSGAMAGVINIGDGATGSDPLGTGVPSDPQLIGNGSSVSVEVQGGGSITNEVLLGILIPNNTTNLFGGTDPLGAITIYSAFPGASTGAGSSAFTGTGFGLGSCGGSCTGIYQGNGFWGAYNTATNSFLQDFLDSNFNNSLNTTNFLGFETGLGLNVTDFGVYTIGITTGPIPKNKGGKGLVDIQIPGGLPEGSILVALGDDKVGNTLESTVWTNAGGVDSGHSIDSVPEPPSLTILGAGLLALSLIRRKIARACTARR